MTGLLQNLLQIGNSPRQTGQNILFFAKIAQNTVFEPGLQIIDASLQLRPYGNGKFGYLPADGELVYDLNTDYLQPSSGEADLPEQPQGGGLSGMQIFFLCALCVSVAAIAALVIRGKKAPAPAPEEDF